MHKHLIIAAFKKAKTEAQNNGKRNPAKSNLAAMLSEYFSEDVKFSINERSLREYYNDAIAIEADKDINIPQQAVINGLCQYVGYDSYQAFLANQKEVTSDTDSLNLKPSKPNPLVFVKKYKTVLLSLLVLTVLVTYIVKINQLCWMVWNGETYEEAPYKAELVQNGTLKLCNSDRLEHFKQLKNITCDTEFFNDNGSAKVWYAKNKAGTLDCFTSYGLHPETGKTLKPISVYMIETYYNCTKYK